MLFSSVQQNKVDSLKSLERLWILGKFYGG